MTNQTNDPNTQNNPQTEPNNSQNWGNGATIEPQAQPGAAGSTAEDTLDGYKALIEQMKSQNEALLNQNKSLQSQFETLIRNGAGVTQQQQQWNGNDQSEGEGGDQYTSLADLGSEIGKCDYKSHNMKE